MMSNYIKLNLQKCSDIDEKYCSYELAKDGSPVMAVSANSEGVAEVFFSTREGLNAVIEYDRFISLLQEGHQRLQDEIEEEKCQGRD